MQTTYRLKAREISMAFLKSVKTLFAGQEVEITVKSVKPAIKDNHQLAEMIRESRSNAPVVAPGVDIRSLIDESQYPGQQ